MEKEYNLKTEKKREINGVAIREEIILILFSNDTIYQRETNI